MVKIAMVQMTVEGSAIDENLKNAELCIQAAAESGADIAVLPECMDIGWTHPASLQSATTIPGGSVFQALVRLAKQYGIFICSGITEREGDWVYNAAVLLDNKGNLLLKHRKINELDIGKPYYATGDRLNVVNTQFGKIGIMICADALPEDRSITTALARMEPKLILSPCAWAVPPGFDNRVTPYGDLWRNAYMPVAKEFQTNIVAVSNVGPVSGGPWKGWDCIGASLAIDKNGNEITQLPFGVTAQHIAYVEVD